jgi:hypothetical protein
MIRRRRPQREIAFSFDSFLDVVANVVGIILRLIIVAWFGAQACKHLPLAPPPTVVDDAGAEVAEGPEPPDPLQAELERMKREAAAAQAELLDQLRAYDEALADKTRAGDDFAAAVARRETLEKERARTDDAAAGRGHEARQSFLSLEELRGKMKRVSEEIAALKSAPSQKKNLRYQTPVSRVLQTEELFFECRNGRVAVIDVGGLLEEMHKDRSEKAKRLASQWEVEGTTRAVGAFRMNYVLERERSSLDGPGGAPLPAGEFSYSVNWLLEPITADRGESADAALAPGSSFRRVADGLDAKQTAVTFWVYADSFPTYRRLRDLLHERDVVVAGRPLAEGMPIGSSKRGTASRGQ